MMRVAIAMACLALSAEVIDRVAVTVGSQVITTSQIRREIRLTALLNDQTPDFRAASCRLAAERLADPRLIRREMEGARYPEPAAEAVDALWRQVDRRAMSQSGLDEADVRAHLRRQLEVVLFISHRFRPGIQIREEEIEERMKKTPAETGLPEEYRLQVEQAMIEERANRLAEQWLKEARERTRIEFREEVFK
ncbi:MAG: hypothetical protein ACRD96_14015 [Bryobacteraceae bacterium]